MTYTIHKVPISTTFGLIMTFDLTQNLTSSSSAATGPKL